MQLSFYLFNHSFQLCMLYSIEWNMKAWWFDKIQKVVIAFWSYCYRDADKSLAWPEKKQAIVSLRVAWICFGDLPCRKNGLMSVCVSMFEIACIPDKLPRSFHSWLGWGFISTPICLIFFLQQQMKSITNQIIHYSGCNTNFFVFRTVIQSIINTPARLL